MPTIKVSTEKAPPAAGPYSQAIRAGNLVYTAGMIPVDPVSGNIPVTIKDQTKQVMDNLVAVLKESGAKKDHVVKVCVYLTDIKTFSIVNSIYSIYFEEPFPARTCVEVSSLPKNVCIMVDAIAYLE